MIKLLFVTLLIGLPVAVAALEDTHGVLIDRGIVRSSTGTPMLLPTDTKTATPDVAAKDRDKKAEDKEKPVDNVASNRPLTQRQTENHLVSNAQNYYGNKHRGGNSGGSGHYYHARNTHIQN